ncbi:hypothetical protein K8Z49_16185 [Actinomadura madurae]|uniref:Uncharacterized protein n=1 Tax=Actinomadura madurae TaxID=1993 RepID=A0A1I5KN58_9ACTN|nr:hypothetical protein [Actinomadura madurae]SFO86465.1 hypothetical protein SAMN04489713_11072 [Actinomadura madurae]SPT49926.1 Uncharacterised protein [Actinomadura madurae]
MKRPTAAIAALASAPAGAAITIMETTGDTVLAFKIALLVAIVIAVLGLGAPAVRRLPELMRIWFEGRALTRVTKAAICGPHKNAKDAADVREAARAYAKDRKWSDPTTVKQVMETAQEDE